MKAIFYTFILTIVLCLSACYGSDPYPSGKPKIVGCDLKIVDEQGQDLLSSNLIVNEEHLLVISPYSLTISCTSENREHTDEYLTYNPDISALNLRVNANRFDNFYIGTLTFKLQLPSVFGDGEEVIIKMGLEWFKKDIEIKNVYLNGVKINNPVITHTENEEGSMSITSITLVIDN
jgi:hypothetical protein